MKIQSSKILSHINFHVSNRVSGCDKNFFMKSQSKFIIFFYYLAIIIWQLQLLG